MGNFDLRDVLSNRAYPTGKVKVWMDEKVFFELAALNRQHANVSSDNHKELKRLDNEIAAKEKERDEQAFTVHLRGTSKQARNDMQTEALTQLPIVRDLYGREDDKRTWDRGNLLTEIYFAEHITKIVDPKGDEQIFTEENKRDLARAFIGLAPDFSIGMVDQSIAALRGEEEMQNGIQQGVDFLSRT